MGEALDKIHRRQVHREPWPAFERFDRAAYAEPLRRDAAAHFMRRAREELGSVHEFGTLVGALSRARVPVEMLGALARLVTDEVRHTELCARMAEALWPEGRETRDAAFDWPPPRAPWPPPPVVASDADDVEPVLRWAADAVLTSCCIGETLSRPLFEAAATVTTDPVCEAVLRQILRDEHLHASFGWAALGELSSRLSPASRAWLEARLALRLGQFERTSAGGITLDALAGTELVIEPGDPAEPNLAMLTPHQYTQIFYATIEAEILPRFDALGLDAWSAWAARGAHAPAATSATAGKG